MHRKVFIDWYYCHEMWRGCRLFQSVSSGARSCCHIHGHGSDGCKSEHKYTSGRFYADSWRWMVWSSGEWWRSCNFAVWTQSFPASEPHCQCSLEWGKITLMWKCLLIRIRYLPAPRLCIPNELQELVSVFRWPCISTDITVLWNKQHISKFHYIIINNTKI
jgi:hypothetical protein